MVVDAFYKVFALNSAVAVMARGILEYSLAPDFIDRIFRETAKRQRDSKELLFSTVVAVMALVVGKVRPAVNAAYQAMKDDIGVSIRSIYNKLQGIEPEVSRALVQRTGERLAEAVERIGNPYPSPIPRYPVRIVDGNHHPASHRRLKVLRNVAAGPLPGQSLVIIDPASRLVVDVVPCEDGHAQERSLLPELLDTVKPGQVWIADRNFCAAAFVFQIELEGAFFVVRQHKKNVVWEAAGEVRACGTSETGEVFEQPVTLSNDGRKISARRITVKLSKPTQDGDKEIHVLSNLPKTVPAITISDAYRQRWTIEGVNNELARCYGSEAVSLGYPKATLFSFCMALVAYNVTAVIQAAIAAGHHQKEPAAASAGKKGETIRQLSSYYLCDEIKATWHGMMIAVPPAYWQNRFSKMTCGQFSRELLRLGGHVNLERFRKSVRGPKKPPTKRTQYRNAPHVSTARLLAEAERQRC